MNTLPLSDGQEIKELLRLAVYTKVTPRPGLNIFGICTHTSTFSARKPGMIREASTGLFLVKS